MYFVAVVVAVLTGELESFGVPGVLSLLEGFRPSEPGLNIEFCRGLSSGSDSHEPEGKTPK